MNKVDISEAIKIGLRNGYKQNLLLLSSYNDFMNEVREYLLTVNVAQQLIEWNKDHHNQFYTTGESSFTIAFMQPY